MFVYFNNIIHEPMTGSLLLLHEPWPFTH